MQVLDEERGAYLSARYRNAPATPPLFGYGTVRDYCEGIGASPELFRGDDDLRDAMYAWVVKTIVSLVPAGGELVEIGGGEPILAQALTDLGYHVAVVDPYDGSGGGPTMFQDFVDGYPELRFVRSAFGPGVLDGQADAVYSVAVLDAVSEPAIGAVFAGIDQVLRCGGHSVHALAYIEGGADAGYNNQLADVVAEAQARLHGYQPFRAAAAYRRALGALRDDPDLHRVSAATHNRWRGSLPYDAFPYRPVVSLTTVARRGHA